MKAKGLQTPPSPSPAVLGLPLYDPASARSAARDIGARQRVSVGPIELRIDGGDGPSAIAILE